MRQAAPSKLFHFTVNAVFVTLVDSSLFVVILSFINRLHEKCMRLIYGDKTSSFEELLDQDKSVSIHTRNVQMLVAEMFKVYRGMSPIISEVFRRRDISYNLQGNSNFAVPNVKSVFHRSESITYLLRHHSKPVMQKPVN